MSGAAGHGLAGGPPPRRRGREAAITFACLVAWMSALIGTAGLAAWLGRGSVAAPTAMIVLFCLAWLTAEQLVRVRGMDWPGSMLGLVGPICLGFGAALLADPAESMTADRRFAIITATSAAGMAAFLFRFRLPKLVSPIVTFTVVSLFLGVRGLSAESLRSVEGFSPRGILAALVDDPVHMTVFGALALASMAFARWLDLYAEDFGMASAKPLHIIGAGVTALIAGRLAAGLAAPIDSLALVALFAAVTGWALRLDRLGVLLTAWFAMARPFVLTLLPHTGGSLDYRDWSVAHMAVIGVGLVLWPVLRKRTVAAGFTRKPRHITWNWPDRVIYPYRPPPGHR